VLSIKVQEGETIAIGAVVGSIDTAGAPKLAEPPAAPKTPEIKEEQPQAAVPGKPQESVLEPSAPAAPEPVSPQTVSPARPLLDSDVLAPSVRRLIVEKNLDPSQITGTGPGGRITKGDVVLFLESAQAPAAAPVRAPSVAAVQKPAEIPPQPAAEKIQSGEELITRKPMSPIRQRIASHLLTAKQNTAMLTTFNDIDMTRVQSLRAQFKNSFKEKYGISLGMSMPLSMIKTSSTIIIIISVLRSDRKKDWWFPSSVMPIGLTSPNWSRPLSILLIKSKKIAWNCPILKAARLPSATAAFSVRY
jgi:2-oxoglutarate dehydrogenase E2 component (dihydrolipoamide succinyltransferase)